MAIYQILYRPVRFHLHDDKKNTTFLHNWICHNTSHKEIETKTSEVSQNNKKDVTSISPTTIKTAITR